MRSLRPVVILAAAACLSLVATAWPGGAPAAARVVATGLVYAERPDEDLLLDVYAPGGKGAYPVVVAIHGGAWRAGSRASWRGAAGLLAAHGFVVIAPDYRLTGRGARLSHQLRDVRTAVRWARSEASRWGGDPQRLSLLGSSAGGHLALLTASRLNDFEAVVAWSPPTDLALLAQGSVGGAVHALLGCSLEDCPARHRSASPVHALTPTIPPTLVIGSTGDALVPFEHLALLEQAGGRLGSALTLFPSSGTKHGQELLETAIGPTTDFLNAQL